MFFRKLTTAAVPLLMAAGLVLLLPRLDGLGFWGSAAGGLVLGVLLALMPPLAGAARRREPFAGLFLIPAAVLLAAAVLQVLAASGAGQAFVRRFAGADGRTVLCETAFAGYLLTASLRALRRRS